MSLCDTVRTANIISQVANSIDKSIQVTIDCPENHPDKRMPVLDLKVRVDKCQEIPRISYTFYKKEIASKYTILKRSAISMNTKRTTLFQEGLICMFHVAHWLLWNENNTHMSECVTL